MRSFKACIVRKPTPYMTIKHPLITPGFEYALAPHADLWMRGAKRVRVKYLQTERESGDWTLVAVAPIVNGREIRGKFLIPVDHFA